jgi:hypothetical protein
MVQLFMFFERFLTTKPLGKCGWMSCTISEIDMKISLNIGQLLKASKQDLGDLHLKLCGGIIDQLPELREGGKPT